MLKLIAVISLLLLALTFASSIRVKALRPRRFSLMKSASDNKGHSDEVRERFQRIKDDSKEDLILMELRSLSEELKEQRAGLKALHFALLSVRWFL